MWKSCSVPFALLISVLFVSDFVSHFVDIVQISLMICLPWAAVLRPAMLTLGMMGDDPMKFPCSYEKLLPNAPELLVNDKSTLLLLDKKDQETMEYPTWASDHLHHFDAAHRNIVEQQIRSTDVHFRRSSDFPSCIWLRCYPKCAKRCWSGVRILRITSPTHSIRRERRARKEETFSEGRSINQLRRMVDGGSLNVSRDALVRSGHRRKPWASPKRWSTTEFACLMNRKWKRWLRLVKNTNVQCRGFRHGTPGSHRSSSFLLPSAIEKGFDQIFRLKNQVDAMLTQTRERFFHSSWRSACRSRRCSDSSLFCVVRLGFRAESPFRHQTTFSRGRSPRETPTNGSCPCWGAFGSPGRVQHLRPRASSVASRTNPSKWFSTWRLSSVNCLRSISTSRSLNKSDQFSCRVSRISRRVLPNRNRRPAPMWTRQTRPNQAVFCEESRSIFDKTHQNENKWATRMQNKTEPLQTCTPCVSPRSFSYLKKRKIVGVIRDHPQQRVVRRMKKKRRAAFALVLV